MNAKVIALVQVNVNTDYKPRILECRYQVFSVSKEGIVLRMRSFETETQCNDYISSNLHPEHYRIVDLNGILHAW